MTLKPVHHKALGYCGTISKKAVTKYSPSTLDPDHYPKQASFSLYFNHSIEWCHWQESGLWEERLNVTVAFRFIFDELQPAPHTYESWLLKV